MKPLLAIAGHDVRLATRAGGSALLALAFFAAVATLVPFGIGSDPRLLSRVAAGLVWIAAILASLLALDRMFQADFEDGSLDLIALGPVPLEGIAIAKMVAHWLTTGLPLAVISPLLALLLGMPTREQPALIASLLIGTPAVSAIGSVGAALMLSVRRGGLILPFVILPLLSPVVIFGAGTVAPGMDGAASAGFWLLAAFSFAAVLLSPFAAAAAIRLNLSE